MTDEADAFYCRCSRGTNNTGEMAGIIQALLWLKHVDKTTRTAAICYDSEWAANMTEGMTEGAQPKRARRNYHHQKRRADRERRHLRQPGDGGAGEREEGEGAAEGGSQEELN